MDLGCRSLRHRMVLGHVWLQRCSWSTSLSLCCSVLGFGVIGCCFSAYRFFKDHVMFERTTASRKLGVLKA